MICTAYMTSIEGEALASSTYMAASTRSSPTMRGIALDELYSDCETLSQSFYHAPAVQYHQRLGSIFDSRMSISGQL